MRTTQDKIDLFKSLFKGRTDCYGSYSPKTGRSFQVKKRVTDKVIYQHLMGERPYGVYLLDGDKTSCVVSDFDVPDQRWPKAFVDMASHYGISAYIETSKSKGHHCWIFFNEPVMAWKSRVVVKFILEEMDDSVPGSKRKSEQSGSDANMGNGLEETSYDLKKTEVFPKQESLYKGQYGSFINCPLFGALVPEGKTVFVDPMTFKPYPDQWDFFESVVRYEESVLNEVIEINELKKPVLEKMKVPGQASPGKQSVKQSSKGKSTKFSRFGLPPCARKMLADGVSENQRVICFRLAVNLNKVGLPFETAIAVLQDWATRNKPNGGKRVITNREIIEQAKAAYEGNYTGYGCSDSIVSAFCDPDCWLHPDNFHT